MTDQDGHQSGTELIIAKGAQLAGALVGGGVGMVGGPVGAFGGAAAGWAAGEVIAAIGVEVMQRMSGRGAERAAATAILIAQDGLKHESAGEQPRDDGFFDERCGLRPEEDELLEAVLLTAANTYEERKLPYLAHLFDGVKYDASVAAADALFMARLADELTYRQLVGLAVFGHHEVHFRALARAETRFKEGFAVRDAAFMQELDALDARALVGVRDKQGLVRTPVGTFGGSTLSEASFGKLRLTGPGETLYRLMRLDEIPQLDRDEWVAGLAGTDVE